MYCSYFSLPLARTPPSSRESRDLEQMTASPTVNTKQALSSVKSWFNNSVLIEPSARNTAAEQQQSCRKSAFAIFKDPSILGAMPEEDLAIGRKSIADGAKKVPRKPFAILEEPCEKILADKDSLSVKNDGSNLGMDPAAIRNIKPFAVFDEENLKPTLSEEKMVCDAPKKPVRKPFAILEEPEKDSLPISNMFGRDVEGDLVAEMEPVVPRSVKPFAVLDENDAVPSRTPRPLGFVEDVDPVLALNVIPFNVVDENNDPVALKDGISGNQLTALVKK